MQTPPSVQNNLTPENLITPENVSISMLYDLFERAFIDVSFDQDGDLMVSEDVKCFVFINESGCDRIRLLTLFGLDPKASRSDCLECVNRINSEYVLVRAYLGPETLAFDHEILIKGGITQKNFILTVKRFCTIPRQAVREYGQDIVG